MTYRQTGDGQLATLAQPGNIFGDRTNLQIFLMTPAEQSFDLKENAPNNGAFDNTYLNQGDNPIDYSDKISQVISVLNDPTAGLFPGAPVSTFVYRRQGDSTKFKQFPYGRAMVSTDILT
jgi:hypothetical protein